MKNFIVVAFVGFMVGTLYLLFNEKSVRRASRHVRSPRSTVKSVIGEKARKDLTPYDWQRMRIGSEAVIKFESLDNGEKYELNEEELNQFRYQMRVFQDKAVENDEAVFPTDVNDAETRDYFYDSQEN